MRIHGGRCLRILKGIAGFCGQVLRWSEQWHDALRFALMAAGRQSGNINVPTRLSHDGSHLAAGAQIAFVI